MQQLRVGGRALSSRRDDRRLCRSQGRRSRHRARGGRDRERARRNAPAAGRGPHREHRGPRSRRGRRARRGRSPRRSTTGCARPTHASTRSATSPAATSSRTWPSTTRASCCGTRSSGCGGRSPRRSCRGARTPTPSSRASACRKPRPGDRGVAHRVYRFAFDEIDRARAEGETDGFAKIVTDPKGKLLGAAIVGAARRRADRRVRARADEGDERARHLRRHPCVSDVGADQPSRRRPATEGRSHAARSKRGSSASSGCGARAREHRPASATRSPRPQGGQGTLLLALFAGVVVAFFALDGQRYLTLETVKANRDALLALHGGALRRRARDRRSSSTSGAVAFSLPGGLVLVADDGLPLRPLGRHRAGRRSPPRSARRSCSSPRATSSPTRRAGAWARSARRSTPASPANAFNYLLFLRLVPVFPFFLVNLAPAFTDITLADVRAGDARRHHSRDVRLRESRADARPHRIRCRGSSRPRSLGAFALLGLVALRAGVRGRSSDPARLIA